MCTQAALDRARYGGDSSRPPGDAPSSPLSDDNSKTSSAAAAFALSPRSAAAIARGAAVALQGAQGASMFAPLAQQKRALWGTSLRVSRWCCNAAFKVWAGAYRAAKDRDASREAERVRAELEDSW